MPVEESQTSPLLQRLFSESFADLTHYFARRCGSGADTGDLVQETFLQMARSLQDGREPECARGYLFGIARKVSLANWRRLSREPASIMDEHACEIAAPQPDERIEAARETIAALPDLQREILDLRFTHQLSYAEIAESLGIPIGTVRSRLHHAIAEVRHRIEHELQ